jgi:hypothetical protein
MGIHNQTAVKHLHARISKMGTLNCFAQTAHSFTVDINEISGQIGQNTIKAQSPCYSATATGAPNFLIGVLKN